MANPFIKAWKYLMAKFDYTVEQDADPAIQIEQAIAEVKRHHQELSQQAATIIGNQRQLEMKLDRQLSSVENIKNNVRQALLMAEMHVEKAMLSKPVTMKRPPTLSLNS